MMCLSSQLKDRRLMHLHCNSITVNADAGKEAGIKDCLGLAQMSMRASIIRNKTGKSKAANWTVIT